METRGREGSVIISNSIVKLVDPNLGLRKAAQIQKRPVKNRWEHERTTKFEANSSRSPLS